MAVEKKTSKKLQDPTTFKKISLIDQHICCAFSGLNADARVLIQQSKLESQNYRLIYDDVPSVDFVSRNVSSMMQKYTQTGGARPFGLSVLIAGIDSDGSPKLNQVDPSGMITCYRANSIGYIY